MSAQDRYTIELQHYERQYWYSAIKNLQTNMMIFMFV